MLIDIILKKVKRVDIYGIMEKTKSILLLHDYFDNVLFYKLLNKNITKLRL